MRTTIIEAITKEGKEGLQKHYRETVEILSRTSAKRLMFSSLGFKLLKLSDDPYTLSIEINNQHTAALVQPVHMITEIERQLKDAYGLIHNKDYTLRCE